MKTNVEPAKFQDLFRFADRIDIGLMIFGSICSIGVGSVLILYANPLGQLVDAFAANRNQSDKIVEAALKAV